MKIGICDDEKSTREYLERLSKEWGQECGVSVETVCFANAESFLFAWEENRDFDVLLLDIEMGQMNGMELAGRIRESDEDTAIVFITGYDEYIGQGYEVAALHYLIKPVEREKLWRVLDRAYAGLRKKGIRGVFEVTEVADLAGNDCMGGLKNGGQASDPSGGVRRNPMQAGVVTITLEDIWYVEAFAHDCAVYLKNTKYHVKRSIGDMEKLLSEKGLSFVRTHRSYLVNLKYASSIWKENVALDDGRRVPLSRRMRQQVNGEFVRYFAKTGQCR
ncbi:MAG: LytTR family DNA-binding domain-containing protein [Lachnospiraceae bacterium]|nr:LytTR family DNA-binding domain-containing protein [Lachnospiraceae bacterium]